MNPVMHEKLNLSTGSPVKIKWCDYDHFKYPFHYHAEYEIIYIVESSGKRIVGNNIGDYTDGDLALYGSFVPHMYRSDANYHSNIPDLRVKAITLQFSKDFFKTAIECYPEFHKIKILLEKANFGITFNHPSNDIIRDRIKNTLHLKNLELLLECINILDLMSNVKDKVFLNDISSKSNLDVQYEDPRMTKVLSVVNREFAQSISLPEIASLAGMNKTAFCRFFKSKTSKTFTQYINELRIDYACELLLAGKLSISQVCYETGFNNISNFNRQFKSITNFTPTSYIEEFKKKFKTKVI